MSAFNVVNKLLDMEKKMSRFLYNWFSWIPILGSIFKGMYVSTLIGEVKLKANNWKPPEGLEEDVEDLDSLLKDEAEKVTDNVLEEAGIDLGWLASAVKKGSTDAVVQIMRKALVG